MVEKQRGKWSSNLGFILASAGSAVGLGNIWKFPGKVSKGGGGAFILIYILIVFTLGASVMLAEFAVGRATGKNIVGAFKSSNKKWGFVGVLAVISGFIIMSYYGIIGGWVIKYATSYIFNPTLNGSPSTYFTEFISSPVKPIIYGLIFMVISALIVIRGVANGIEKASKILMPSLLVLLIIIMIRSVTLKEAEEGLRFLTTFNFKDVTVNTFLIALGQAFFSLSLGMGVMCTYGSYLSKNDNLAKNTMIICSLDTAVALISAFAIIPAVFAAGTAIGEGGSFAFVALPEVFNSMPLGRIFGGLFYLLLFFAALTSSISIIEAMVAYITEEKKIKRTTATISVVGIMMLIGGLYSISMGAARLKGIWFSFKEGVIFPSFGEMLELIPDVILIPLGSLAFAMFVGWVWGTKNAKNEISQNGMYRFALGGVWSFCIKYIIPVAIAVILAVGFSGYISF